MPKHHSGPLSEKLKPEKLVEVITELWPQGLGSWALLTLS